MIKSKITLALLILIIITSSGMIMSCTTNIPSPTSKPDLTSATNLPKAKLGIPSFTIMSPNGGEVWHLRDLVNISWKSTNRSG